MSDISAADDLAVPDDCRGAGPPPSAQGYGDRNKGCGERPQQIFTGEAKSWLPLEDREGAEQRETGTKKCSSQNWPALPIGGRQPTGDTVHNTTRMRCPTEVANFAAKS